MRLYYPRDDIIWVKFNLRLVHQAGIHRAWKL